MPVLVCLTFADKFYAEHMSEDGQHPEKETTKCRLEDQLTVSQPQAVIHNYNYNYVYSIL